jgi:hypothetical protein
VVGKWQKEQKIKVVKRFIVKKRKIPLFLFDIINFMTIFEARLAVKT